MEIDYDPKKSNLCLVQRGFDFDYASRIFDGPTYEIRDTRHLEEVRVKAIGMIEGRFFAVIYTERRVRRIISARRANRKQRRIWHEALGL